MIQAVIFDLDGTVLDNEGKWEDAFSQVAEKNNIDFLRHEPGIGVLNNWKKLVKDLQKAEEYARETKEIYMESMQESEVEVRDGVEEFVGEVKALGWQTALATGSEWNTVENELEHLNLYLAFDITTTGEEVLALKPDPEIYTLTVQKLGFEAPECVVIEDSIAGVESAVEAGCIVVGLANEFASAEDLKAAGAKLVVDNFSEVMVLLRSNGN